jgi:hypothetical protein
MGTLRRISAALTLGLVLLALPALAQTPYSRPSLSVLDVSRTSVKLQVQAGSTGAPAGYTVEWMPKAEYDEYGWAEGYGLYSCHCWGTPTWNMGPAFQLGANATGTSEMGDTWDETGVTVDYTSELTPGTEYVFRAYANGNDSWAASEYSETVIATTDAPGNCTYTQGYWKTHPEAWPVASLTLGSVVYNQAQLLSIFNQPAAGNGLLILAHQLIATKLNVAMGADPTPVAADIANADALIGALVIPPVGADYLAPATVNATASALDNYNNGNTTVPHCGETPSRTSSWGRVKTLYR